MELVSQREYARRIGVSHVAVNKLVKAGTIPLHDGKINPAEADRCRAAHCDPEKLRGRLPDSTPPQIESENRKPPTPTRQAKRPPPSAVKKTTNKPKPPPPPPEDIPPEGEPVSEPDDGRSKGGLTAERERGEQLKNRQREISIAEAEKRLVDKEQTKRAVFGLARQIREHWQNWPARIAPIMAADLGIDPKQLQGELDRRIREHLAELADPRLKL